MEIRRLQYFACVAELGSLCRASDVLRIAQPALTRQVRLLEEELGVKLFTRSRRGMRLTEEGEQLLADVGAPLRQLEGALQNIRSYSSGLSGNVAVGMTPTVAYFLAQPLLERMAEEAPNVVLRIVEGTALHLEEALVTGELDMALLYEPVQDHNLVNRELLTEEMVIIGPPQSGLAPDRPLTINDITRLPLILPNPKNGLRGISERYAAKYNVRFEIKYVIDSFPVLKEMVGSGHGYSIMPLSSVLREVEDGTLTYAPVIRPARRTLMLASKTHCRIPRIVTRLDQLVREVLWDLYRSKRIFGELKMLPDSATARQVLLKIA
jgi:LysR family transcriptional regulator, nitrogen assimilation regulatory protein